MHNKKEANNQDKATKKVSNSKELQGLNGSANVWNDENVGHQPGQELLNTAWTKQTEQVYNNYKKELVKSYKDKTHHRYSKCILTTDLASIFRMTRDRLKERAKGNNSLISLKELQKVTDELSIVFKREEILSE